MLSFHLNLPVEAIRTRGLNIVLTKFREIQKEIIIIIIVIITTVVVIK